MKLVTLGGIILVVKLDLGHEGVGALGSQSLNLEVRSSLSRPTLTAAMSRSWPKQAQRAASPG